jgi:hypothetical protein
MYREPFLWLQGPYLRPLEAQQQDRRELRVTLAVEHDRSYRTAALA